MEIPGLVLMPFGPSSAAMPGEEDHRETIMSFREIYLLEGKRPDLVAFDETTWAELDGRAKERISSWPTRRLDPEDRALVAKARFGAEVKISKWDYGKRRIVGGGSLSVTVKDEELNHIRRWQANSGRPVLFFQALLDEIYCMSFRRMEVAIKRGWLYEPGDVESGKEQGAGGKYWHRIHVDGEPHLCGGATFPDQSSGEVRVLENGSVVAFVSFAPAKGFCVFPGVVYRELEFAEDR